MCQKLASHRLQSGCGVQASGPQAATASYPAPAVPDPYPLSTIHYSLPLDGRAVPALPCAGGLPPQRPPCNATVCAPPQLTRQPPGSNATMCARFQLLVNAPRTRCGRRCASPIPPFEFRVSAVSDHYPLSTIHCTSLQNVLYCKVESEHTQAGPERAAYTHMPAHHAQTANHVDLPRTERPNPAPSELRSGPCR